MSAMSASISVRYSRKVTGTWASRSDVKNCKNMTNRLPAGPCTSRARGAGQARLFGREGLSGSLDLRGVSTRSEPPGLFNGALSMGILAALVIGAIAGWLAGLIVRGAGFGLIGNIVIGIIGALVPSWLLPQPRG